MSGSVISSGQETQIPVLLSLIPQEDGASEEEDKGHADDGVTSRCATLRVDHPRFELNPAICQLCSTW